MRNGRERETRLISLKMGQVVPGPKFFLNRTGTKMLFLDRDRDQNIFDWDRHQNLFLKGPRPRPKTFSRRVRDRERDQNIFFRRDQDEIFFHTGSGTGIKNHWSRYHIIKDNF